MTLPSTLGPTFRAPASPLTIDVSLGQMLVIAVCCDEPPKRVARLRCEEGGRCAVTAVETLQTRALQLILGSCKIKAVWFVENNSVSHPCFCAGTTATRKCRTGGRSYLHVYRIRPLVPNGTCHIHPLLVANAEQCMSWGGVTRCACIRRVAAFGCCGRTQPPRASTLCFAARSKKYVFQVSLLTRRLSELSHAVASSLAHAISFQSSSARKRVCLGPQRSVSFAVLALRGAEV